MLSHAEASATARTLQSRPEVEGKHGSVPGRRLPRAATYHLAGPRPHLTRWGPTRGTEVSRRASPPGSITSNSRHSGHNQPTGRRASPFRADANGGGKSLGKEPRKAAGAGGRGLTLTGKPSSSTEQGGHGGRPTRTQSLGCAGVTQESSQTPPTALYKAKHSPASPLDPSALKEWLPARTCRRPPT